MFRYTYMNLPVGDAFGRRSMQRGGEGSPALTCAQRAQITEWKDGDDVLSTYIHICIYIYTHTHTYILV